MVLAGSIVACVTVRCSWNKPACASAYELEGAPVDRWSVLGIMFCHMLPANPHPADLTDPKTDGVADRCGTCSTIFEDLWEGIRLADGCDLSS